MIAALLPVHRIAQFVGDVAAAVILIVTSVVGAVMNRRSLTGTGRHREIPHV
ncbi:hypothetical protein [Kutzneria sp. 744]|uniref:hypothetical protein n=1 Tax=Kutzneria sp. (strain 744) TaxID=345341 RepID=UPI0004AF0686|nr:hypothetical protein [Kutzneria sp. 744]